MMQRDDFNELMVRAIILAKDQLRLFAYTNYDVPLYSFDFSEQEHEEELKNKSEISNHQYNDIFIKICKKDGLDDPRDPEKTNKTLEKIGSHLYQPLFKKAKKVLTDVYNKTHNLHEALNQADSMFIKNIISHINDMFGAHWTQNDIRVPTLLSEDHQISDPDLEVSSWMPEVGAFFTSLSDGIRTMCTPPITPVLKKDNSSVNFLSFFLPLSPNTERSPMSVTEMNDPGLHTF